MNTAVTFERQQPSQAQLDSLLSYRAQQLSEGALSRTRLVFLMLFGYLLSQAYLIPVLAIGPSWAIWPRFADLTFVGMVGAYLIGFRDMVTVSERSQKMFRWLLFTYLGCFISFLFLLLTESSPVAIFDGIYDLTRLAQFFILFWIVSRIPLSPKRVRMLRIAVDIAFIVVCGSIVLTYLSIVPLGVLTAHLPQDPEVAGNWADYAALDHAVEVSKGLGTVSYSHAYGGIQILMLLALRMLLVGPSAVLSNTIFLLVAIVASVLTESRAGLASTLVFAGVFGLRNPRVLLLGAVLGVALLFSMNLEMLDSTLRRQSTIVDAFSDDNLSGRQEIWNKHIAGMNERPFTWLVGGGLGSARANGNGSNAHNLVLQILVETGVVGVICFSLLMGMVLTMLYRSEKGTARPIFWGTIALLISGLTQETFYPVPSQAHFTGLFLVAVALAIQIGESHKNVAQGIHRMRSY